MENELRPKVSVIIPTYNNVESLKRTLNSVLVQDFEDYEVIITDDSDNESLQKFLLNYPLPKIKYFKNSKKLGSPENWNEGLRIACGEYIKIMHHDDWFSNTTCLGKFVNLLDKNPDCDFGYSKSINIETGTGKEKKRKAEKYVKRLTNNCFMLFLSNRIGAPSVTIFRNKQEYLFDKNLKWVVDIDFYINALTQNNNIAFIKDNLVIIGLSESQITKSCQNNRETEIYEYFYLYKKYQKYLKDEKYQKELIKILKKFKIRSLDELKKILPADIEIPELITKSLKKKPIFPSLILHKY